MSPNRSGWASQMACSYALRYDVLNRGHMGINTDTYVKILRTTMGQALGKFYKPSLVILMLGTK
jgi:hypothetical protein